MGLFMKRILILLACLSNLSLFPADPADAIGIPSSIAFPSHNDPETGIVTNFPFVEFIYYATNLASPVQLIIDHALGDIQEARTTYNDTHPAVAIPQIDYVHIDIRLHVTNIFTDEQHDSIIWLDSRYPRDPAITLAQELVQVLPDDSVANNIATIAITGHINV